LRGPGNHGGAHVAIAECAIYNTSVGIRAEDQIERVIATGLAFDRSVKKRIEFHNAKETAYQSSGEHEAPNMEALLRNGFPAR
jgi:hypothetical protein